MATKRTLLYYNPIDIECLTEVLKKYEGLHHGQLVTDFETAIQNITGSPYVLALNSGTSAIHLGLKALGVGVNDFVFVSTFTFVGTVNPIIYLGANPVFIDSEPQTWNMDPVLLEQALVEFSKKGILPKAIVVVHTYGMPARMDEIMIVANKFGVPVLEDAAEAVGSKYKGKHAGTLAQVGVLSFNNNKTVTTFGGGVLLTPNYQLYQKAKLWASQATMEGAQYQYEEVGFNYKMGPLNAAMGLASLKNLEYKLAQKRTIHNFFYKNVTNHTSAQFQGELPGHASNYWLNCFIFENKSEKVAKNLGKINIETRPFWKPMHLQPHFAHFGSFINEVSQNLYNDGLCLPSSWQLSQSQQQEILDVIITS